MLELETKVGGAPRTIDKGRNSSSNSESQPTSREMADSRGSLDQKRTPRVQSGPLSGKKNCSPSTGAARAGLAASASRASGGKFNFSEARGDLFDCPLTASLAHCVSEDMAMGKGIAKAFKEKFGGVNELKKQGCIAAKILFEKC